MEDKILGIAKKLYHNHITVETGAKLLIGILNQEIVTQSIIIDEGFGRYTKY